MNIGRFRPGWGPVFLLSALALSVFFAPIPAIPLAAQTISGRLLDSDSRTPVVSGTVVLFDAEGVGSLNFVLDLL